MIVMLSAILIFPAALPPRLVLISRSALSPRTRLVAAPPSTKLIFTPAVENVGSVPARSKASAVKV